MNYEMKNLINESYNLKKKDVIYTGTHLSDFEHLANKYNVTNEKERSFLYYVLDVHYNREKSPNGYNLVVSLYNETDTTRIIELLFVLSENLQNPNIKKIHILYEVYKNSTTESNINLMTTVLYSLMQMNLNMEVTYLDVRPTFKHAFDYCNEKITGSVIVSNSDIIYNRTLKKILSLREDSFFSISRKNLNPISRKWKKISLPEPKEHNIFSQDTWCFISPMKYPVPTHMYIGEMFSDSYMNYLLSLTDYKCYNFVDVDCLHIQSGDSVSDKITKDPELSSKLIEQLYSRENGNKECIMGLYTTTVNNYYSSKKHNKFISLPKFLKNLQK